MVTDGNFLAGGSWARNRAAVRRLTLRIVRVRVLAIVWISWI
jgi:hypothetical protein